MRLHCNWTIMLTKKKFLNRRNPIVKGTFLLKIQRNNQKYKCYVNRTLHQKIMIK